jgi:hypothetical protein
MGWEWYRAVRVEAVVGIRRSDLDPVLAAAQVPASVLAAVRAHTELEPLHVALVDEGFNATNTPPMLALEVAGVQVDAGVNEVPRAVCELATGRDATAMADGAPSDDSVSVAHVIERYLGKFIPVRIYARATVTAAAGAPDGEVGDLLLDPPEWVLLFDGLANGTTRRGDPENYRLVLHLTHFLAALEFSSSLTGLVAPGTEVPFAVASSLYFSPAGGGPSGFGPFTPAGYAAATLAGGIGLYTDFWGFNTAPDQQTGIFQGGLKTFLSNLANHDLFDWRAFSLADAGAVFCPDYDVDKRPRRNDKALAALARIEPFGGAQTKDTWQALQSAIIKVRDANTAAGSTAAVTRADLVAKSGGSFARVGYRYGVPSAFYLNDAGLAPFSSARGFASDVAFATFGELGPASFWELLAGRYAGRYQLMVAPMADRALVVPFQPLLDASWQTVYASEVFTWDDDVRNPAPVRGVVLVSDRKSDSGWLTTGAPGAPQVAGQTTADAAFDSCEDGAFVYRAMPEWLVSATRHPAPWAARSALGARAKAAVPATALVAAQTIANVLLAMPDAAGLTLDQAYALLGVPAGAVTAPSEIARSTGSKMAKALFQQIRTSPHSVYLTGRFRFDIGPGSVVSTELPGDRYVKAALVGNRDTRMTGIVLRMTVSIDRQRMTASTSLQLGFCRTEGEAVPTSVLFADGHPFWTCVSRGAPWSDSLFLRTRLGDNADINFRIPLGV